MSTQRLFRTAAPAVSMLISEAHVLDPGAGLDGPADVLIRDGQVAEIAAPGSLTAPTGAERIDGRGRHLFPGFVDPHVHLRTPGQEHKEDLQTGTRAAAAGGYCAVVAMPNTEPPLDSPSLLLAVRESAAREACVPVGFMPAISRGMAGEQLTDMSELRGLGALGFTDDGLPVVSAGLLRRALQYQRLCGGVLALHEEDPSLSAGGSMHEGEVSAELGIAGIAAVSESTMVARDAALAAYEEGRVHMQHLSCVESVRAVAAAKEAGVAVTAEASPHHLLLSEEDVRTLDTRVKMNPPLRSGADREALVEALRSGVIDCIATDHAPHHRDDKEVPFEEAAFGTTGLETAFAALYSGLVLPGEIGLDLLVARLTAGAAVVGLPVPRLAVGEAGQCLPRRPGPGVDGGRGRLREPLGELLLCRAAPARARAPHPRRRLGRLSRARVRAHRGMRVRGMLDRARTALVVVDVQEGFRPVIAGFDELVRNTGILIEAARALGLPIVVSEQYPRGLGETVPEVAEHLGDAPRLEKVVFSAARADGFDLGGREQILVCGIETHVCVSQTVHDLWQRGSRSRWPGTPSPPARWRIATSAWRRWSAPGWCPPRPRRRCSSSSAPPAAMVQGDPEVGDVDARARLRAARGRHPL